MNEWQAQIDAFYAGTMQAGQLSQENFRCNNSVKCDPSQKEFLSLKLCNFQFFIDLSITYIYLSASHFSRILTDFCYLLKTTLVL